MTDSVSATQRRQGGQKNLLAKIVTFPFTLFGVLCASLLISIIIECVGMHLFWPQQGWQHAQAMFYDESGQLSEIFTQSILISDPVQTTQWLLDQAYEWIFIRSGIADQAQAIVTPTDADSLRKLNFRQYIGVAYGYIKTYVLAAAFTTLTFIVRVLVLFLSLPLMLLAIFVGFIDGLVRRDIRRMTSGYESGFVYHRARSILVPLIVLPWMIYLALPVSVTPVFILLPGAMLLGAAVNMTASSFKRYL